MSWRIKIPCFLAQLQWRPWNDAYVIIARLILSIDRLLWNYLSKKQSNLLPLVQAWLLARMHYLQQSSSSGKRQKRPFIYPIPQIIFLPPFSSASCHYVEWWLQGVGTKSDPQHLTTANGNKSTRDTCFHFPVPSEKSAPIRNQSDLCQC